MKGEENQTVEYKGARLYASFFLDDVRRRGLPVAELFFQNHP